MNKSPLKINFEPRTEEDRSISKSRSASNLERKRIEVSLYKTYFRISSGRGTKPFQASCGKGKEYHFESRAEEKRSHKVIKNSKPRAEKRQSINSSRIPNLVRKRKGILFQDLVRKSEEVKRSSRTINLGWTRIKVLIHEISKPRVEEERNIKVLNYFDYRVEENLNHKIHQKILNLAWNRGKISGIIVMENLERVR